jgi:hypothetical protein
VAGFTHYRPIISIDATFLTEKYRGTLMVAVGITVENQLLLLHLRWSRVRTMRAGHGFLALSERKY